jgi:hypothetical protein
VTAVLDHPIIRRHIHTTARTGELIGGVTGTAHIATAATPIPAAVMAHGFALDGRLSLSFLILHCVEQYKRRLAGTGFTPH